MRRLGFRILLLALATVPWGAACSHRVSNATPGAGAATPAGLCAVAGEVSVTLSGDAFDVMMASLLTGSPQAQLPAILLQRTHDATGVALDEAPVAVAGTAADAAAINFRWRSRRELTFDVDPARLPSGVYDVIVEAPGGQRGTLPGGLVLLPPPQPARAEILDRDDGGSPSCAAGRWVTVTGDFFVQSGLVVRDGGAADGSPIDGGDGGAVDGGEGDDPFNPAGVPPGPAAAAAVTGPDGAVVEVTSLLVQSSCHAIDGAGDWARCTELAFRINGMLPAGSYDVAVVNLEPFGCRSTQPVSFTCSSP